MAGTWIIMKHDLPSTPEVKRITRATGAECAALTVGRLHAVWVWADKQTEDGRVQAELADVDDEAGCDGFAQAMVDAGWLSVDGDTLVFPNFGDHNGKTAKTRAKAFQRQQRRRSEKRHAPVTVQRDNVTVDRDHTEQNSTVQKKENAARSCLDGETPPQHTTPKSADKKAPPVTWDAERGFSACSFRRLNWAKAYPLVDLNRELAKAHAWYLDNPARRKRSHTRFLGNWLSNAQERAEQDAKAGRRSGVHLNDQYTIKPEDPEDDPIAKARAQQTRNAG
ncbi:MAG: hypothetical protein ACX94C_07875 [Phycisphaerales bacterium]